MTDLAALSAAAKKASDDYAFGLCSARVKAEAMGAYADALIKLHRTGNLVQIDREGMRDKLRAVYDAGWDAHRLSSPYNLTFDAAAAAAIAALRAENERLRRGECICVKCGRRQDATFTPGDF